MSKDDTSNDRAGKPPRLLGWRSLLFALVCGLGLAVLSVPVSAEANPPPFGPLSERGWSPQTIFLDEPYAMWITSARGLGGRAWNTLASRTDSPFMDELVLRGVRRDTARRDPRPARARGLLFEDGGLTRYVEHGFPLPAAFGRSGMSSQLPPIHPSEGWATWTILGRALNTPTKPLWWGLAGNTIFYATPILLLLTATRLRQRARRRRKDRCVACNYDLSGTLGPCPECGCVDLHRVGRARAGVGGP